MDVENELIKPSVPFPFTRLGLLGFLLLKNKTGSDCKFKTVLHRYVYDFKGEKCLIIIRSPFRIIGQVNSETAKEFRLELAAAAAH